MSFRVMNEQSYSENTLGALVCLKLLGIGCQSNCREMKSVSVKIEMNHTLLLDKQKYPHLDFTIRSI